MKTAIQTGTYVNRYGFNGAMARIKELEYDGIDYQSCVQTDTELFSKNDKDFDRAILDDAKIITDNGLEVFQVHGPWRFPPQDVTIEDREERFEKMVRTLRATALLNSRNMIIHPLMPWGCAEKKHADKVLEINLEFMSRLTEEAKKHDVIISYENMPMRNFTISTPQECLDVAKSINSPNFKICLDTGHCTMHDISPADAVRLLGKDYLQTLHIHDNDGRQDLHWLPFSGVIDWCDFKKALADTGFEGAVSIETTPSDKIPPELLDIQDRALFASTKWMAG